MAGSPTVRDAMVVQAQQSAVLGSPMYASILEGLLDDFDRRGITWQLLEGRSERPLHDAVPLRLLAAVHRIVLRGDAPALAARFPSAGGDGSPVQAVDVLDVLQNEQRSRSRESSPRPCRPTRWAVRPCSRRASPRSPAGGSGSCASWRSVRPRASTSTGTGTGTTAVRRRPATRAAGSASIADTVPAPWAEPIDLRGVVDVVERRGCDAAPLDPTDPDDRRRLLSFVWPDQTHRFERLAAALEIAGDHPPTVDAADAGDWLSERLQCDAPDAAGTVVYHSIVWQYLSTTTRDAMRAALRAAGETVHARAHRWPGCGWSRPGRSPTSGSRPGRARTEEVLAHAGYHGQGVRSGPPR